MLSWRQVYDFTKVQIDDENTKWIRDQMIFNQPGEFKQLFHKAAQTYLKERGYLAKVKIPNDLNPIRYCYEQGVYGD